MMEYNHKMKTKDIIEYLNYYNAIVEFVEIYSSQHIGGNPEINIQAVASFMAQDSFMIEKLADGFNHLNKDDLFKKLEEEVLNGFPIWRLLILSEWTMNMLERDFVEYVENTQNDILCFSCGNFISEQTNYGLVQDCVIRKRKSRRFREEFELTDRCMNYEEQS